jgi:Uma2 family endonuclease
MSLSINLLSIKKYQSMEKLTVFSKKKLDDIKEKDKTILEFKKEEAIKILNNYKGKILIASPNKGQGETRTVILGNNHGRWCQLIKIWADTKSESMEYAKQLLGALLMTDNQVSDD